MPFCQVIVDINHTDVDHVFTYRVPKGLCVCPGMRVHVPFGPRKLEGVVVEMTEECDLPPERVKDVCDTLEDYPAVLPPLLGAGQRHSTVVVLHAGDGAPVDVPRADARPSAS